MVSGLSIGAILFTLVLSVGVPVGAFLYFKLRLGASFVPVVVGAGIFIVFSRILETVLNLLLLRFIGPTASFFSGNTAAYCIYGGFVAGIFEESGRFLAFMVILKKYRDWRGGVAYGIGHGGMEALLIGGLTYLNYLIYALFINGGQLSKLYSGSMQSVLTQVTQFMTGTSSWMFGVAGLERVFAFAIQIALSLVVLYGVTRHKYYFWPLAVVLHALVDFPAALYQKGVISVWWVEAVLLLLAVVSCIFIVRIKKRFADAAAGTQTCGEIHNDR